LLITFKRQSHKDCNFTGEVLDSILSASQRLRVFISDSKEVRPSSQVETIVNTGTVNDKAMVTDKE